ncbi:MAG: carboxypeptidase regulatory-like domain-containing protein [Myxococcota bacterium]
MRLHVALCLLVPLALSCRDLSLPSQPGVGDPGAITGRVVWQRPGRLVPEGAKGASIFLLGTNAGVTANDDGRFVLEGVTSSGGTLLIRFDADRDGVAERQRTFALSELGAARGRTVSLGEVSLSQPGAVTGRVLRGDVSSGHEGTPVFAPGLPLAALTASDGTFTLEGVVEGPMQLAAVRAGYEAWLSAPVTVRGGEELRLSSINLVPTTAAALGVLRGRVVSSDGSGLGGVTVKAGSATATSDGEGGWLFQGLSVGRYDLTFQLPGRLPVILFNVLVAGTEPIVVPDVVMLEGAAQQGTPPSLLAEVQSELDAGVADAGLPPLAVSITGAAQLSVGSSLQLTAVVRGGTTGNTTYSWSASPQGLVNLQFATLQSTTLTGVAPGTVSVKVDVERDGQTATDTVMLQVRAVDGGTVYMLSTDAPAPFTLPLGARKTVTAFISPPASQVLYEWRNMNPAVVTLVNGTSDSFATVEAADAGNFSITLHAEIAGVPYETTFVGFVPPGDAGVVDAGLGLDSGVMGPLPFVASDAGITPLAMWVDTPEDIATVVTSNLSEMGQVVVNQATKRLVAVFWSPPANGASVSLSATVALTDGGLRALPQRTLQVPVFQFADVQLANGASVDFNTGVAFAPEGPVVTGRYFAASGCDAGCFYAASPLSPQEALLPDPPGPATPWSPATAAGAQVYAWHSSTKTYQRSPGGVWSVAPLAPGATFADGPLLRALRLSGSAVELHRDDVTTWSFAESVATAVNGNALWAHGTSRAGRRLVVLVDSGQTVRGVESTMSGPWLEPMGLNVVTMATKAWVSATSGGDVLAIDVVGALLPSFFSRSIGGNWQVLSPSFPFSSGKVVGLASSGGRAFVLLLDGANQLRLFMLTPGNSSVVDLSLPTAACPVSSAALAVSDFGDLSVSRALDCGGVFELHRLDLRP